MSRREVAYLLLAVLGLVGPTVFNAQYVAQGGNLFDIVAFFSLGFVNPASSSLTVDLLIAFTAFVLWTVPESRRLGMRAGWLYPILGVVIAFAFPLFLFHRERHLRVRAKG